MIRPIAKDQPLKILGFTDTHLDDHEACRALCMRLIQETIRSEKPDLVVFVGDNVTGGDNRARAEAFTRMLTELKTPWCPVLGNHEGDNPASVTREEMVRLFRQSPYCLIPAEKPVLADGSAVFGETNYAVPLFTDAGKICHKLIFLDGGAYMARADYERFGLDPTNGESYDYLKDSQIAWYRAQLREDDCPSTVFCHIPLPEFEDAWTQGERQAGEKREKICSPLHNSGMFDAIAEGGKTVAYVTGHDHINDFRVLYRGVYMIYNRMSGLSSYNLISKKLGNRLLQGCSVYYIDAQGRLGFGDLFYEDRYPYDHDDIYAVIRK